MKKRCIFAPLRSVKKRLRLYTKRKGAKARRNNCSSGFHDKPAIHFTRPKLNPNLNAALPELISPS